MTFEQRSIAMVVQARFARGNVQQIRRLMRPMFPTPPDRPGA